MADTAVKLTKVQREALAECVLYADRRRPFYWRRASMDALFAMGLVDRFESTKNARMNQHVPTRAGRRALLDALKDEGEASHGAS